MTMKKYGNFIKNFGILGTANFVVSIRGLLLLPLLTKILGPEQYGMWAQLSITLTLVASIAVLGLPSALVRFLAAEKVRKNIQEGIWSSVFSVLFISLLIVLVFSLFAGAIGEFLHVSSILISILGFIILFESINLIFLNMFRVSQQIGTYSFFIILSLLGEVGLVGISVIWGYGLLGAVVALLLSKGIIFLLVLTIILKRIGFVIPRFSRLREYFSFGIPTVMSNSAYWGVQSSDRYLIAIFLGILSVGYYAPAYALGNILHLFIMPFALLLPPVLSKLFEEQNISEIQVYLKYSLKYFLFIAIPAVFGLSVLSREILTLFSTNEIASQSHTVIPLVATSLLLYGVYTILVQPLYLAKKTKLSATIWIIAALINVGLNLFFIPIW